MITVEGSFRDYCNRCLLCRPYCETLYGSDGSRAIVVKCEDEERCEWLHEHIRAEMEKKD